MGRANRDLAHSVLFDDRRVLDQRPRRIRHGRVGLLGLLLRRLLLAVLLDVPPLLGRLFTLLNDGLEVGVFVGRLSSLW